MTGITYKQIAETIKERIKSGEYPTGKRLPSERELANDLDAGRALVRIALDQLLSENWLHMPSPRIRMVSDSAPVPLWDKDSNIVAMIGADRTNAENSPEKVYTSEKRIIGVTQGINELGLLGMQFPNIDNENFVTPSLRKVLPKGLVYFNENHLCDDLVKNIFSPRMPVVTFGDTSLVPYAQLEFDSVSSDHYAGGEELVEELCQIGCEKVLFFHGDNYKLNWRSDRRKGILKGCSNSGIKNYSEVKKIETPDNCDDKKLFEHYAKMTAGLLMEFVADPLKRPDVIIIETDVYLPYVGRALQLLGIEPNREILLVGYDNYWKICPEQRWCNMPPAVTVDKGDVVIGKQAVRLLLKRAAGELPEGFQHIKIIPSLVKNAGALEQFEKSTFVV